MITKVFTDASAEAFRQELKRELQPLIDRLAPGYEVTGCGLARNFDTSEVDMRIHLKKRDDLLATRPQEPDAPHRLR